MKLPKRTITYHTCTSNFSLHTVPFHFHHSILITLIPPIPPSHSSLHSHCLLPPISFLSIYHIVLSHHIPPLSNILLLSETSLSISFFCLMDEQTNKQNVVSEHNINEKMSFCVVYFEFRHFSKLVKPFLFSVAAKHSDFQCRTNYQ